MPSKYEAEIIGELHRLQRRIVIRDSEMFVEPYGDHNWILLPEMPIDDPLKAEFVEKINQLDAYLEKKEERGMPPTTELYPGEFWSLGSVRYRAPPRAILRGFLEPVLRVQLLDRVPDRVVAFLISIEGDKDLLLREHHSQVGWHYHYLDKDKRRSDVVLCWDTRAPYCICNEHPLFQEKHGEGKSKLTARPELWADKKRQSMHTACVCDLTRWSIDKFRCASKKALPVWPKTSILTPHPDALSTVAPPTVQKFRKKHS